MLVSVREPAGHVTSARSSARSEDEWWRYLAAPFVYPDVPYLFVASLGIVIFGSAVEQQRRHRRHRWS